MHFKQLYVDSQHSYSVDKVWFKIQVVHAVAELHAEQLVGQTMQEPFDKYLPISHVIHN